MGTEVHGKSYLPGYYSMRDLNEDSNGNNWPILHGEKTLANGQQFNGFLPRTFPNLCPGHDKETLKQTMLEHETIFKHQVFELHRLYRIQRDMMDEFRRKELHKHRIPLQTSSSSNPFAPEMSYQDARVWRKPSFSLGNSMHARPCFSNVHVISSPLSCTKANAQTVPTPSQNGYSSIDCEILESRPSKVRKRLFDLQLPADEYIDTEEGEPSPDNKISDIIDYPSTRNHQISSECGVRLNLVGCPKVDHERDASKSASHLRGSVELADLNEPVQVEETMAPVSINFMGHPACQVEVKSQYLATKSKSQSFLGLPKEILQKYREGNKARTSSNLCLENKRNGRDCLPNINEAEHHKSHLNSICQGIQPDKSSVSSQPTFTLCEKAPQPLGFLPSDQRKDMWRENKVHGLELPERRYNLSGFDHKELAFPFNQPYSYPLAHLDKVDAWSHSVSSWGKSNSCLTQKLTSVQTHPSLHSSGTLSSSQLSAQSRDIFGDKWHLHMGSALGSASALPNRNGFCHGSSSGSKNALACFPSFGIDHVNFCEDDNMASDSLADRESISLNLVDMKPVKDTSVKAAFSKSSCNGVIPQQGLRSIDEGRKHEDHVGLLYWLKTGPAFKPDHLRNSNSAETSFPQASANQLSHKSEIVKDPKQHLTSDISSSCDNQIGDKPNKAGDDFIHRNILGFPILDYPPTSKDESSSLASTSASLRCTPLCQHGKKEGRTQLIDINVACNPESDTLAPAQVLTVEDRNEKVANIRTHIDLNSCVTEDEMSFAPSGKSNGDQMTVAVEIDLEAPAIPETDEDILPGDEKQQNEMPLPSPQHKAEKIRDEDVRIAAEAIVSLSFSAHQNRTEEPSFPPLETSMEDPLLWFADFISSSISDIDDKICTKSRGTDVRDNWSSSCEELDYFEAMTLSLPEVKPEEYMPIDRQEEEMGAVLLPNRTRRGQARRGRQRRDFQRDILPGLASLSRHEVTQDIQTFCGLMRATGHTWQSGLTRRTSARNGGARGRRQSVVELAPTPTVEASTVYAPLIRQLSVEVGLEDRSLTVWGKTARRPRRQRYLAGNSPTITLT